MVGAIVYKNINLLFKYKHPFHKKPKCFITCRIQTMKCVLLSLVSLFTLCSGCASTSKGPGVLLIDSSNYAAAFDAAASVARADGMKPAVMDRRGGYIHTHPAAAGSIVEPWIPKASSARKAL